MSVSQILEEQLRLAVRNWKATFAAWIEWEGSEWQIKGGSKLTSLRRQMLKSFLNERSVTDWLKGALVSGRTRSRNFPSTMQKALGRRATAIPAESGIILVGGDLGAEARKAFRIIAIGARSIIDHHAFVKSGGRKHYCEQIGQLFTRAEFTPESIAQAALTSLQEIGLPFRRAFFGIVQGGQIKILQLVGKAKKCLQPGQTLQWKEIEPLRRLFSTPRSEVYQFSPCPICQTHGGPHKCTIVPIFWHSYPIAVLGMEPTSTLQKSHEAALLHPLLYFIRWMLECALTAEKGLKQLQWKTRWDDVLFSVLVSRDFAGAVFKATQRLKGTYGVDKARVLIGEEGKDFLIEQDHKTGAAVKVPIEGSISGYVYQNGTPFLLNSRDEAPQGVKLEEGVQSALVVPLKAQDKIVGVIELTNTKPRSFSEEDKRQLATLSAQLGLLLEKMKLQSQAQRRAQDLALIHKIVSEVIAQSEEKEIACIVAKEIANHLDCELSEVFFSDPVTGKITAQCAEGLGGAYLVENKSRLMQGGVIEKVAKSGKTLLINDTTQLPFYKFSAFHALSELCVPILSENKEVIGIINLEHSHKNAFTEEDKELIESIAGVLSAVLSNVRRYQALKEQIQQSEAVRAIGSDIAADLDLDTMLQRIVRHVAVLSGAQGVDIGLLAIEGAKKGSDFIRIVAVEGAWRDYVGYSFRIGKGVSGRAAMLQKPVIVHDYPFWEDRGLPMAKMPVRSAMALPIMYQDSVLGVLTLYDARPDFAFTEKMKRLLEPILPQIAMAIRNAMMYRELQLRIEAQRSAEEQLLRSARLAAIGELASGIAHELNNPLTSVAGFLELALGSMPKDLPQRRDVEIALQEAKKAARTVRDLLNFTKARTPVKVAVNVDDLLSEDLSLVNHLLHRHGVFLNRIPATTTPLAEVNPLEIKQVFLNLIINAVEAMPNGGTLTIRTTSEKDEQGRQWHAIYVQDTGKGLTEEEIARIFEPLSTTNAKGRGMGLAISYSVVRRNGGKITVKSAPNQGTTFIVHLPAFTETKGKAAIQ